MYYMYSASFSVSFTDIPTNASTPFPIELTSAPSTEKFLQNFDEI